MADGENKNDQQNLEQPPLTIITKVHGVDREWNYMKTVDYADEFEKIRTQHRMNFSGQSMFGKRTKYICQNAPKLRGGCKFKMLVQMSEDEESFHIYTADQHNHPIMDNNEDDNDDQQHQSNNDETATNSICSSSKHPPEIQQQQNFDQKNERTKEKELTEDLKSVENGGKNEQQKLPTNSDQKSNKWRLIRTILGKPDAKLIKTEYEVESTDERDEKRIMFFCLHENPKKCNFRMQLIKVPDSQNWKLYARFEHCHPLESEQILQQTRKRNISDDGKQKADKTIPNNVQTPPKMFSLLDFKQNVELLGSELNLNVREEGGCLIISSSNDSSRLLVLADEGKFIQVSEFKQNRHTGYSEDWQKSDLKQFLRAIHGRCEKYFFSTTKRPKIEEKMTTNNDT